MRVYAKYAASLIALYLVVYNGTKAGKLLTDGAKGAGVIIKDLQGRG